MLMGYLGSSRNTQRVRDEDLSGDWAGGKVRVICGGLSRNKLRSYRVLFR